MYHDQTMKAKFHKDISKKDSDYLVKYAKKIFIADKVIFNQRMNAILLMTRTRLVVIAEKKQLYPDF